MTEEKMLELAKKIINEKEGFIKYNNMQVLEVTKEHSKMKVDLNENSLNPNGVVHGGLLFGLADTAMGVVARTTNKNVTTINAQIDYLKPGTGNVITCIAEPIKIGKTTGVYRAHLYNEEETLISTVTGTFLFID